MEVEDAPMPSPNASRSPESYGDAPDSCGSKKSRLEQQAARSVYVSKFSGVVHEDDVRKSLATQFGPVEHVHVDREWGRYAIVRFHTVEAAQEALAVGKATIGNLDVTLKPVKSRRGEVDSLPELDLTAEDVLSEFSAMKGLPLMHQMRQFRARFSLTDEDRKKRMQICKFLHKHFSAFFDAEINFEPFGSTVTGFATQVADLDINMTVTARDSEMPTDAVVRKRPTAFIESLAALHDEGVTFDEFQALDAAAQQDLVYRILVDIGHRYGNVFKVRQIAKSKTPVVHFIHKGGLQCEISVNNELSVIKANFVPTFIQGPREVLPVLLFVLRVWAQQAGVFGSSQTGKLTALKSYAFSLIFIASLQHSGVLPPVKTVADGKQINGWDVEYVERRQILVHNDDDGTVKNLLKAFFVFVAQHLRESDVICIRLGRVVPFAEFVAGTEADSRVKEGFVKSLANVQDPIELSHNVAARVSHASLACLRRECCRALSKLKSADFSLASLLDVRSSSGGPNSSAGSSSSTSTAPKSGVRVSGVLGAGFDPTAVAKAAVTLLTDVLLIDVVEDGDAVKRLRIGDHEPSGAQTDALPPFFASTPTWIGRRAVRRELASKDADLPLWQLEKMVSNHVKRRHDAEDIDESGGGVEFRVDVDYDPTNGNVNFVLTPATWSTPAKTTELFHFLRQFLVLNECALLKSCISALQ